MFLIFGYFETINFLKKTSNINQFERAKAVTAFALFELSASSEFWRFQAAFDALSTVLDLFPEGLKKEPQLLKQIIYTGTNACHRNNQLDSSPFLDHGVNFLKIDIELWEPLASLSIASTGCSAFALGQLIIYSKPDYSLQLAKISLDMLQKQKAQPLQIAALFTLLFEKVPKAIPKMISLIININLNSLNEDFKLIALKRGLSRLNSNQLFELSQDDYKSIGVICAKNFHRGGLELAGYLLVKQPQIGIFIFSNVVVTKCVHKIEDGTEKEALNSIRLISLFLSKYTQFYPNSFEIVKEIAKIALEGIKEKGDKKRSKEGMGNASYLLKQCSALNENATRNAYDELSSNDKESLKKSLGRMQVVAKPAQVKLTLFSKGLTRRRRRAGDDDDDNNGDGTEWQSLDD